MNIRFACISLLMTGLAGWPVISSATASLVTLHEEVILRPSDLRIERRDGVDHLSLEGGVEHEDDGRALLPEIPVTFNLPEGMSIRRIAVRVVAGDTLAGLNLKAAIPDRPARAGPTGRLRGRTLGTVLVTPFDIDSETGRLIFNTRLEMIVDLEPAAPPAEPLFIPQRAEPWADATFGATAERLTRRHAGAMSSETGRSATAPRLHPFSSGGLPFHPTFRPSIDGTPVEYLIITDAAQEAVYQELADWKTQTGIPAVVRTVEWIHANTPQGVDLEETLRNFIRDAAEKWGTIDVLLGGDTSVIPIRYAHTTFFEGEDIPTDLYYQCLDGTWNGDGDAVFGEGTSAGGPGDNIDLYADVYVGRLPTNNAAEARVLVDKILAYQKDPPRDGSLTRMLAFGEVLFPSNWTPGATIILDGADVCETALASIPPAWEAVRLYENCPSPAFPACIPETKSTVLDSINAGFGILHHVGHGFVNTMSVGIGNLTLNNADALSLHNGNRTSLLYAINCTSSAIDFSCIAEKFLLNPDGGAVASIGSTRVDFPLTSREYQDEFYRLLFQETCTELGRAIDGSRLPFIPASMNDGTYRWMQMTPILLGDPRMAIWTAEPTDLSVTAPATFPLGGASASVTVTSGGSPVPGARICFHKPGDDYAVGLTDSTGTALIPFAPDSLGAFTITATALNAMPWTETGTVVAAAEPHVFVASTLCNDSGGAGTGNSDGRIDAGETVELFHTLQNRGGATGDSLTATLSTASPFIEILDAVSRTPGLGPDGEAEPLDPMVIRVDRGAPDRTEIPAHLSIDDGSAVFEEDLVLRIHAPKLEWYRMTARDSTGTGDNDGVIEPGEPFVLRPELRNRGLGPAVLVKARLSAADPVFTITDSLIDFGTIPGEIMAIVKPPDGFEITMADTAGLAAGSHRLTVSFYDSYSAVDPFETIDITPPGAPPVPANLTAEGLPGAIELTFAPVVHASLRGYNVYRSSTAGGPFTRINADVTDHTSYYKDDGLTPFVFYYYRVSAQDSSGNESPLTGIVTASTSLPLKAGFPAATEASGNGSVTIANLDTDLHLEVLGAGEEIYALNGDGTEIFNGDGDASTIGPLTNSGGPAFWNAPAVADVDRDGSPDVAAISWTGSLYLWTSQGAVKPGFPRNLNISNLATPNPLGSVAMADADGDGRLELFCFVGTNIFAFHADGTELLDGDNNPSTIGIFRTTTTGNSYGTPALADLTGDGRPEIIAGMRDGKLHVFETTTSAVERPGFPFTSGGSITASAAVGDLDNDGAPDIVFGSSVGSLFALKADGTAVAGWPQGIQLLQDLDSSPALGDLTGDGVPDVVCGASNGRVFAWRNNGTVLPGFPVLIRDSQGFSVAVRSSPCLADIDSDGVPEILVGDQIGRLHAFRATGEPLPGFPVKTENAIEGGPAAWDLDGDGLTEIVAQSFDQKIYVWDTPWTFNPAASPWPMFHHDPRHTGDLNGPTATSGVAPGDRSEKGPAVPLLSEPNPFSREARIHFRVAAAGLEQARVDIFSAAGRRVRALFDRSLPAGNYSLTWDGCDDGGRRLANGVYYCRLSVGTERQNRKMVLNR